jgi:CheY-like chemotaxis protein
MKPGGVITVTVKAERDSVAVSVADAGIGIDATELPRVFEMFAQLRRDAEQPDRGGLGIGLALVQRLVELHGGSVSASSEGIGKGATFTVRLPLDPLAPVAARFALGTPQAARESSRRVLVVDDNADAAISLALLLEGMGHLVKTAHDGEEAFRTAEDFRPQVIFMDIAMPRVNGLDAARRIRDEPWGAEIVICALTGFGQLDDRARSRDAGIAFHLVKPVDTDELEAILGR